MNLPTEKFIRNIEVIAKRENDKNLKKLLRLYIKNDTEAAEQLYKMYLEDRVCQNNSVKRYLDNNQPLTGLQEAIEKIDKDISFWIEDFKEDPLYHFEYYENIMALAVKRRIYNNLQLILTNDGVTKDNYKNFIDTCTDKALSMASYIDSKSSSSTVRNLIEEISLKVYAEIAKKKDMVIAKIGYWFEAMEEWEKEYSILKDLEVQHVENH
jgi:hypothetical protein